MGILWVEIKYLKSVARLLNRVYVNRRGLDLSKQVLWVSLGQGQQIYRLTVLNLTHKVSMDFYVSIGKIKLLNPSFLRAQIWWDYYFWCQDFKFCSFKVQKWPDFSKITNKVLDFSKKIKLENLTTSIWQVFSFKTFFLIL